jgi:hypothetical protein
MPISVSIYNVHHHIRAAGVLLAALFSFVQEGFVRLRDTTSLAEGKARGVSCTNGDRTEAFQLINEVTLKGAP